MTIKGTQGQKRIAWVDTAHPWTAVIASSVVHANHNEAQNSALRRQNAQKVEGLQRVLDVHRLVHNWVRPHRGLAKGTTQQ